MLGALCKRRNIRLKYERFANAEVAAAVYNVNRGSAEVPMITAWDFVRDAKSSKAHSETLLLKKQIKEAVGMLPSDTSHAKLMNVRKNIIAGLEKLGRTDAVELWAECWPTLVPKEG